MSQPEQAVYLALEPVWLRQISGVAMVVVGYTKEVSNAVDAPHGDGPQLTWPAARSTIFGIGLSVPNVRDSEWQ